MNRENIFENRIYSIAIPDRNYDEGEIQEREDGAREGIAWFIANSPPLPNDNNNYRRYRRGLERQPEIEMMLIDHQWQARRGQRRARVVPKPRVNERGRVCVRIRNPEPPAPAPVNNRICFPRWSLFQVWNNLAYVTCSVPYRIAWDDQKKKYVIKHYRVQQVFCGIQLILSTVEMISWWRQFAQVISDGTIPLLYVQFGYQALLVIVRICYLKTAIFGIPDLLQVHSYVVNAGAAIGYQIQMGKIMTGIASVGYAIYFCGYSGMGLALYTYRDLDGWGWDWGPAEFIQTFACYARKVFIWATSQDCPDDIFSSVGMLSRKEILYGCLGILTYSSGIFIKIHTTLMMLSSCLSLLSASHSLTNTNDFPGLPRLNVGGEGNLEMQRPLTTRYEFLEKFSGEISSFVGLVFLVSLGVMGISMSNTLDMIFNNYENSFLLMATMLPIVILIISCLCACVSAMQIDAIEDQMTEMDNFEQLPNDIRRLIIYLHRLFRRSPGIGYRGLFVMNFVHLVTYCGAVAGLVAFAHENKKPEERSYNGYN